MRFLTRHTRTPIGLDIGGRFVCAAQLEKAHGAHPWRVVAAAVFPRAQAGTPLDRAELRRVMDVLDRRGFAGESVVIPVPGEKLISGVLEVPGRGSQVPVEQIARMELARTNRCAPDSFEMGCWDLPAPARQGRTAHVMAVGCAHADADALLDLYQSEGIDVAALDVRPCALARATAPVVPASAAVSTIMELGWESANLVMMYGGAVVYGRSLVDGGARSLHEALHAKLNLEADVADYLLNDVGLGSAADGIAAGMNLPPQARSLLSAYVDGLVQELNISFSYVSHEYPDTPLTRLVLTGTSAAMPGLADHLASVLGVEVKAVAPADVAECPPPLLGECAKPALIAAMGLAQFQDE